MSQKAVTDELGKKVNAEEGKGLSTNDYTDEDKTKVANAVLTTEQTLNEEQQAQARINIRALGQRDSTIYDIVNLTWTTDAATTRKSIPVVNRKNGLKISYRNASKVYIVEQYQSEDISDSAWVNDANWKGCRTPLTPLFESLPEVYFNDETGFYEVWLVDNSGLNDVTEEQMIEIYKISSLIPVATRNDLQKCNNVRAIIPIYSLSKQATNTTRDFHTYANSCINLEYFRFYNDDSTLEVSTVYFAFSNCIKLRKIGNVIGLKQSSSVNGFIQQQQTLNLQD